MGNGVGSLFVLLTVGSLGVCFVLCCVEGSIIAVVVQSVTVFFVVDTEDSKNVVVVLWLLLWRFVRHKMKQIQALGSTAGLRPVCYFRDDTVVKEVTEDAFFCVALRGAVYDGFSALFW